MTWTYSGDPSSTPKDAVRFLSGDTDANNPLLQDEEIEYLLTLWGTEPNSVAQEAAMAIAGVYQAKADFSRSVGDLSLSTQYQNAASGMLHRVDHLKAQNARYTPPSPNFDTSVFNGTYEFSVGMDKNTSRP